VRQPRSSASRNRSSDASKGDDVGGQPVGEGLLIGARHRAKTQHVADLRPVVLDGAPYPRVAVAAANIGCARTLRPDLPITAVVAKGNVRSQRAVGRAGLREVWRGPDPKDPDPTATLLLYADRALSPEQVRALTA